MEKPINELTIQIEEDYVFYNKLFTYIQVQLRNQPSYVKYEAYKDIKLLFMIFPRIYLAKTFNFDHNEIKRFSTLTSNLSPQEQRDLYKFLLKNIEASGFQIKSKKFFKSLSRIEMKCCINDIKEGRHLISSSLSLISKITSYNFLTLTLIAVSYSVLLTLITRPAPYTCFQLIEVEMVTLSKNEIFNHYLNVLTSLFDLESKMQLKASNFKGVILLIVLKTTFILLILNYITKKLLEKIKLK